jgi:DNA-directed RNA polymerase subunit RPC12/RpoP
VDHAKLETATLAHVDDSYYFGAYCRKCGHHARLSLVRLRAHLGDTFALVNGRRRLRCERCGDKRQVVVTFLTPAQRTGSLVHLFDKKPNRV